MWSKLLLWVGGILTFMVYVHPKDTLSNFCAWLQVFGLKTPAWLDAENTDRILRLIAFPSLCLGVVLICWPPINRWINPNDDSKKSLWVPALRKHRNRVQVLQTTPKDQASELLSARNVPLYINDMPINKEDGTINPLTVDIANSSGTDIIVALENKSDNTTLYDWTLTFKTNDCDLSSTNPNWEKLLGSGNTRAMKFQSAQKEFINAGDDPGNLPPLHIHCRDTGQVNGMLLLTARGIHSLKYYFTLNAYQKQQ